MLLWPRLIFSIVNWAQRPSPANDNVMNVIVDYDGHKGRYAL